MKDHLYNEIYNIMNQINDIPIQNTYIWLVWSNAMITQEKSNGTTTVMITLS